MSKTFRHISCCSLFIAGIFLVAHIIIPHHHHESQVVVLKDAIHQVVHKAENCISKCGSDAEELEKKTDNSCKHNHESGCWGKDLWAKVSNEKASKHACGSISSFVLCEHELCSFLSFVVSPNVFAPPLRNWVAIEFPSFLSFYEICSPRVQSLRAPPFAA